VIFPKMRFLFSVLPLGFAVPSFSSDVALTDQAIFPTFLILICS